MDLERCEGREREEVNLQEYMGFSGVDKANKDTKKIKINGDTMYSMENIGMERKPKE